MVIKRHASQLDRIEVGQRVRIRQLVRIGSDSWRFELTGVVRGIESSPTGIHTERRPQDDFWIEALTIEKPDGERSRVVVDEHTEIELIEGS